MAHSVITHAANALSIGSSVCNVFDVFPTVSWLFKRGIFAVIKRQFAEFFRRMLWSALNTVVTIAVRLGWVVEVRSFYCRVDYTMGNESVPKIITNTTINVFFKLQSAFCSFKTITVSECCSIILLQYILNGQHREPALCQLYRHIFVPYFTRATLRQRGISCRRCLSVCVCHKSKYYRNGCFFGMKVYFDQSYAVWAIIKFT